jgi:hypothetical protein
MAIAVTKSNPVENETTAASSESPIFSESAPFMRDCKAIKTPEIAESSSNPTTLSIFLISAHSFKFFRLEGKSSEVMAVKGQSQV